jgi:DNA-binding ferritin-like protein
VRWLHIFFVFIFMTSVFVPLLSVRAQPNLVPHEDPAAAQNTMDSYSFLVQYAQIFAFMSANEYSNASRLSEELTHITVPEELSYLIERYNNLTQQLISILNDLQSTLDNASNLLDQYRLVEAGRLLDQAGVLVAQAQIVLGDLQDATLTLSQRFGVFTTPADSKVKQAYDQLQNMLQKLEILINHFHALMQEANKRVVEITSENLAPTMLTLALNPTKCFVGEYSTASGVLSSGGQVLQNRAVELFLDGNQIATANTGPDGYYHAAMMVPYKYVDSVSVSAIYTPSGNDRGVYLASLSPTTNLEVLFYETDLEILVPGVAYPGLSLAIEGNVTSQDGTLSIGRQVKILIDDALIAETETNKTGTFTVKPVIDSYAKLGNHNLTVTVEPDGLYAGATVQRTLVVQKRASIVNINAPSFIMLPSQFQISGTVNSASGALREASVLVEFENETAKVKTLDDGSFSLTLNGFLNTGFAGYQGLKVTVQPSESWQAVAETRTRVFVLNSATIGIALVSSFSIFTVTYAKFVKTKRKKGRIGEVSMMPSAKGEQTSVSLAAGPETKFEGIKGEIVKLYIETLKTVQSITGDPLMPYMTLREYMRATASKIGGAADPYFELTMLAERCLYSPYALREKDLQKATSLACAIRRALNGGIV